MTNINDTESIIESFKAFTDAGGFRKKQEEKPRRFIAGAGFILNYLDVLRKFNAANGAIPVRLYASAMSDEPGLYYGLVLPAGEPLPDDLHYMTDITDKGLETTLTATP